MKECKSGKGKKRITFLELLVFLVYMLGIDIFNNPILEGFLYNVDIYEVMGLYDMKG